MGDVRSEIADPPVVEPPDTGSTGHPLFPRAENETGPDLRRIDIIQLERMQEDGTWEGCPRLFKASELQSWKDVVDLYGGGIYRARALSKKGHQFQGMTERKDFKGAPSRPFLEEAPKPKPVTAPANDTAPTNPQGQAWSGPTGWAPPLGPPPGWTPPNWTPPPGWTPPSGWTPAASASEPPGWLPLLLKVLERPAQPANEVALFTAMIKAQAEQAAAMAKAASDRDAMLLKLLFDRAAAPAVPTTSPLEVIREVAPLLKQTTAPGQFLQGVELAKSLLAQAAPPPEQEDFATTLAGILRAVNPQMAGFPGLGAPAATAAPPAPGSPPPAPAAAAPVPVLTIDDVLRMAARDPNLAQRFMEELGRNAPDTGRAASEPAASPGSAPAVPSSPPRAASSPATGAFSPRTSARASASSPARSSPATAQSEARAPTSSTPMATERARAAPHGPMFDGARAEEAEGLLTLDLEAILASPELQSVMAAAGEDGRRSLLLSLTGQTIPAADADSVGPEAAEER